MCITINNKYGKTCVYAYIVLVYYNVMLLVVCYKYTSLLERRNESIKIKINLCMNVVMYVVLCSNSEIMWVG